MLIGASAAHGNDLPAILTQITAKAVSFLQGHAPNLTILFLTPNFADQLGYAIEYIFSQSGSKTITGCTAEGVIGPEGEFERVSSASIWMGYLPNLAIETFFINEMAIEAAHDVADWQELFHTGDPAGNSLLFLGDPYSLNVHKFLDGINHYLPGLSVIGGMASGADESGLNALVLDSNIIHEGAVCALIKSALPLRSVVSQGCRPIGKPYLVTGAERNIIHQLGSNPPLAIINEIFHHSPERDQTLIRNGVFIGRVINEYQKKFKLGDFLIRNVIGGDKHDGSIAVMDTIPLGTTVQFHIRDEQTADEELHAMLDLIKQEPLSGALLFNCNGRGSRLYSDSNHDLRLINRMLNHPPIAGCFCAGEFGPISGKNFIHGHTASLVIFPAV